MPSQLTSLRAAPDLALVCVYYRVSVPEVAHVTLQVRDIQRKLIDRFTGLQAEVLLRCALCNAPSSSDASSPSTAPAVDATGDATLMETYRLKPSSPEGAGDLSAATLEAFLQALAVAATGLAPSLSGARHVEVFRPCAS